MTVAEVVERQIRSETLLNALSRKPTEEVKNRNQTFVTYKTYIVVPRFCLHQIFMDSNELVLHAVFEKYIVFYRHIYLTTQ